ncbi:MULTISPECIES: hypothetical protein [Acidianus]|uniref:Uncharacterized protein n=1 Tax=Candidatus Acidianus copahuensis TaxID=1160895 RepID=A0A031LMI3_9CREN|nr:MULTISPECIES: hypothetical protein [Acidianus]EZQ02113.1 hypothetical protein CM19_10955 [Candidatus Acidianus copahuensis]NON62501.1 hypothetical protein [Acidianus sp. RZ1]
MSFILRLFAKYSGIDEAIKTVANELERTINEDQEVIRLLYPGSWQKSNGVEELKKLAESAGVKVELKQGVVLDPVRRSTALSSNMTPVEVENAVDILWEIAKKFGVKLGSN